MQSTTYQSTHLTKQNKVHTAYHIQHKTRKQSTLVRHLKIYFTKNRQNETQFTSVMQFNMQHFPRRTFPLQKAALI